MVWVHDPWRPVPGRGGHLGLDAGLCDRADLDGRADVACFTTAPLQEPLELWGQFELLLSISSDQNNFDLCGAISVLRAGQSQVLQLCTGMLRLASNNGQQPLQRSLSFQPLLASLQRGRPAAAVTRWFGLAADQLQPQHHNADRRFVIQQAAAQSNGYFGSRRLKKSD